MFWVPNSNIRSEIKPAAVEGIAQQETHESWQSIEDVAQRALPHPRHWAPSETLGATASAAAASPHGIVGEGALLSAYADSITINTSVKNTGDSADVICHSAYGEQRRFLNSSG